MISQTTEYALRASVCLAQHATASWTTEQIAAMTQVPTGYLSKVLQGLSHYGIVLSQRGRHGGFQLAKAPEDMTVLEVINAVEPLERIHHCPPDSNGSGKRRRRLCPLHRCLDQAIAKVVQDLGSTTLADLLAEAADPLCTISRGKATSGAPPRGKPGRKPRSREKLDQR